MPMTVAKGSERTRRSSVPRRRFAQNMFARDFRKLLGNQVIKQVVGNNPNIGRIAQRSKPIHCLLNHGALAVKSQHLLRQRLPASRPESSSTSTRKNHRSKLLLRFTAFDRHKSPTNPALRSSPAYASRLHPQHRATPRRTTEYVRRFRTLRPEQRQHAPRSTALPPDRTPT